MDSKGLSLDLGFDRQAVRNPGNRNEALLLQGITRLQDVGNPIALSRNLKQGDQLRITLYDLSVVESHVDLLSFRIDFRPARRDQERTSPVAGGEKFSRFKIFGRPSGNKSTVFEETRPVWFVELCQKGDEGCVRYPRNQLQPGEKGIGDTVFELAGSDPLHCTMKLAFYYTMKLKVRWTDGFKQTYRVDPEMITTPDGAPPRDGES